MIQRLATPNAALIDQSGGRAMLEISGPMVREVLRKGVTLDLHPEVFRLAEVALTSISHISALLCRTGEDTFLLAVPRSYAGSLWHWLSVSAAEFGYEVNAL